MTVVQHRSTCFGANVRVLAEALLGADSQKPLVGVSISGSSRICVGGFRAGGSVMRNQGGPRMGFERIRKTVM